MKPDDKKLGAWLKSKGVKPACAACGKRKWSIGDTVAGPLYSQAGAMPGVNFPMVVQICDHCAFVRVFAGVTMGLA